MRAQTARKNEDSSDKGGAGALALSLVQQLVRQVCDASLPRESQTAAGGAPEVMLDVEVDGVRCVLMRSRRIAHRTCALLSPREYEIVRMVAEGYPNKTIAAVLDISAWTVNTHLRRIFAKVGVGSRAAMIARLLEEDSVGEPLRNPPAPAAEYRRKLR